MRVLVMGGTEFISLHLVRALVRAGHGVTVFNRGRRADRLPSGVTAVTGDRKDHAGLKAALSDRSFDAVFDTTYAPTTGEDVAALADAVAVYRPHVIFVSSGRVYDHALPIPYHEDTPRGEYWGDYARHKIAGEDALLERHRASGLPVTIIRPTHVLGPLNTRYNETFFFDRILRGRPVLVPGHGARLRQFGHVEDLAELDIRIPPLLDRADGVEDGGVVPPPEHLADLVEAESGEGAGKVHAHLPRLDERLLTAG